MDKRERYRGEKHIYVANTHSTDIIVCLLQDVLYSMYVYLCYSISVFTYTLTRAYTPTHPHTYALIPIYMHRYIHWARNTLD